MAGFFGMSTAGKNARGRTDQIAYDLADYGNEAMQRARGYIGRGETLDNATLDFYTRLMNGDISPEEMQALGARGLPGLNEMLARRQGRLGEIGTRLGQIPGAEGVMGARGGVINDITGDVANLETRNQNAINSAWGRLSGDEAAYNADIMNRINNTFQGNRERTAGTFGRVKGDIGSLYGGLEKGAGSAYDRMIEMVKPGSEARAATNARAFAPQMASTMGRIRRAGLDSSSPEAQSLIGRVESARSRAIDDQLSGAIAQQAALTGQKFQTQAGFRERGGTTVAGLDLNELSQMTGLDMAQLGQLNQEQLRNLASRAGMEREQRDLSMGNFAQGFGNRQALNQLRLGEPLLGRNLSAEDYGRYADYMNALNNEEMIGRGLQKEQLGIGEGLYRGNLNTQMAGAGGVGSQAAQYANRGAQQQQFGVGTTGQGYGALNSIVQREAQNSGWGSRLLGSIVPAALSMIPGVGPFLGPMAGAAFGAYNGGGQQGGGGGFQMPSFGGFGGGRDVAYGPGGKRYDPWSPNFNTSSWGRGSGGSSQSLGNYYNSFGFGGGEG